MGWELHTVLLPCDGQIFASQDTPTLSRIVYCKQRAPFYKSWNLYDVWEHWNQRLNSLFESCLSARRAHQLMSLPLSFHWLCPRHVLENQHWQAFRAPFPLLFLGMTNGESFRISQVAPVDQRPPFLAHLPVARRSSFLLWAPRFGRSVRMCWQDLALQDLCLTVWKAYKNVVHFYLLVPGLRLRAHRADLITRNLCSSEAMRSI